MTLLFQICWICWLFSEIFLNRVFRSKKTDSGIMDRNSLNLIWITIILSISIGIYSLNWAEFNITNSDILRYIGLVLILSGMIIRFISIRTLGKFFTVDLSIHEKHELINTGLYKYIRHPSYTGSLLSFLGFGLSLNSWISLAIIFLPVTSAFLYRITIEEKLLQSQFGSVYVTYKKHTKRLVPFIY
jgi:protein-S-isoprenylcysteine O-methyltransferase Ste14